MNTKRPIQPKEFNASIIQNVEQLLNIIEAIDKCNEADPNFQKVDGNDFPKELFFGIAHYNKVLELNPNARAELLIAARSQHICRWEIQRSSYPEGRTGYLKWRSDLKKFHAEKTESILNSFDCDDTFIEYTKNLNLKKGIKSNPDCQTLEDALCLVFLEFQFDDLISRYSEEKIIDIVQKTVKKMSTQGIDAVSTLPLSDTALALIQKALV